MYHLGAGLLHLTFCLSVVFCVLCDLVVCSAVDWIGVSVLGGLSITLLFLGCGFTNNWIPMFTCKACNSLTLVCSKTLRSWPCLPLIGTRTITLRRHVNQFDTGVYWCDSVDDCLVASMKILYVFTPTTNLPTTQIDH